MKKIFIVIGIISVLILAGIFAFSKINFTGDSVNPTTGNSITLKVAIPCPGHAWLIEENLKELYGITEVSFRTPNYFDVIYDSEKISKQEIFSLSIFDKYKATEVLR